MLIIPLIEFQGCLLRIVSGCLCKLAYSYTDLSERPAAICQASNELTCMKHWTQSHLIQLSWPFRFRNWKCFSNCRNCLTIQPTDKTSLWGYSLIQCHPIIWALSPPILSELPALKCFFFCVLAPPSHRLPPWLLLRNTAFIDVTGALLDCGSQNTTAAPLFGFQKGS